eukprot:15456671-Alexandrium_andersonii.AAC.1
MQAACVEIVSGHRRQREAEAAQADPGSQAASAAGSGYHASDTDRAVTGGPAEGSGARASRGPGDQGA